MSSWHWWLSGVAPTQKAKAIDPGFNSCSIVLDLQSV